MDHRQINIFLEKLSKTKEKNIIIIDFANVDRWEDSLGWTIGLKKLGQLVSKISFGKKFLRLTKICIKKPLFKGAFEQSQVNLKFTY